MVMGRTWSFVLGIGFAAVTSIGAGATTLGQQLRGTTWELVSLTITTPDGKKIQPLGTHPLGYTMFDRTGRYVTTDLNPNVPKFASGSLQSGTDAEYRAAALGSGMDFGTYTVDDKNHILTKHVIGSSFPNWKGIDLQDTTEIKGDEMIWNTPSGHDNVPVELVWKRATKKN